MPFFYSSGFFQTPEPKLIFVHSVARRAFPTYAGPLIKVRRDSDNATADIGFNGGGDLDQAALLAHVGAANGFIEILYDQSGNGRDAQQLTHASQPRIASAGVVDILNGRPVARFFADSLELPNPYDISSHFTFFIVAQQDSASANQGIFGNTDGFFDGLEILAIGGGDVRIEKFSTVANGALSPIGTQKLLSATKSITQATVYSNGVQVGTASSPNGSFTSSNTFSYGKYAGSFFVTSAQIQECWQYDAFKIPDRVAVENEINAYYNIY